MRTTTCGKLASVENENRTAESVSLYLELPWCFSLSLCGTSTVFQSVDFQQLFFEYSFPLSTGRRVIQHIAINVPSELANKRWIAGIAGGASISSETGSRIESICSD